MEPESVNKIAERAEQMRREVMQGFSGNPPELIEYLFGDRSFFFLEEALTEWRRQERFDDLIQYVLYQYADGGSDDFWQQLLLDLTLKNDEQRAHTLLDGLYEGRARKFRTALKNYRKHPDNHLSAAACAVAKGAAMKILYEHAFLLENKPEALQNKERIEMVRARIREILSEKSSA